MVLTSIQDRHINSLTCTQHARQLKHVLSLYLGNSSNEDHTVILQDGDSTHVCYFLHIHVHRSKFSCIATFVVFLN